MGRKQTFLYYVSRGGGPLNVLTKRA